MPDDTLTPIEIVPATWRDTWALAQLDRRSFSPIDAYAWYEFFFLCTARSGIALKALSGDRLIGFIAADQRREEGHTIIVTIAVDPNYRRRGIGERLMREVEMRSPLSHFRLMVRKSNARALNLYRRLDYQIVDSWPHYYGDGEAAYVMEKTK